VRRWRSPSGVPDGTTLRHGSKIIAVAYNADASAAATESSDRTVRLWRLNREDVPTRTMRHADGITAVCFIPASRTLVSASNDKTVSVWDVERCEAGRAPIRLPTAAKSAMATDDLASLLTVLTTGGALIWRLDDEPPTSRSVGPSDTNRAVLSRDGKTIATVGPDGRVRLWNSDALEQLGSPLDHEGKVTALSFNCSGTLVLTGTDWHAGHVWSVRTGQRIGPPLTHFSDVQAITVTSDGRFAATAAGSELRFWNVETGEAVSEKLKHGASIESLQFTADDKRLLCASRRWLYAYDFDGTKARLRAARFLPGFLMGPQPIQPADAEGDCLSVAVVDGGALVVNAIQISQPHAQPLSGDPEQLRAEWQTRLALSTARVISELAKHRR